jgi:NAD(P)-dependent dehydrogenase (short-subunit alcohol dehydrogenase family)
MMLTGASLGIGLRIAQEVLVRGWFSGLGLSDP